MILIIIHFLLFQAMAGNHEDWEKLGIVDLVDLIVIIFTYLEVQYWTATLNWPKHNPNKVRWQLHG